MKVIEKIGQGLINPRGLQKRLSIVIPVFNKWNFTKSCLQDLSQLPLDHEIIVVDNGSTDETQVELKKNTRIIYLRSEVNLGFAKACNGGYGMATAPHVLFLNNDIRVQSNFTDWTEELIKRGSNALAGPTMGLLDNQLNFVREANSMITGKNSYMSGWCLASSKEIWEKLRIPRHSGMIAADCHHPFNDSPQIFSEEFGLAYFEDTDLSFRAAKLGINREVVNIPVVHFGRVSSKQLNTHQLYNQARQIFIKKWSNKG